ncbi:hypothetical protein PCASD_10529 [Puccinia coronata f. sp. avenae]|uniref:Uncharacterized protein n=1 Tax=Puccinia coronata f. sp. avenae TaxID=200324 RepID=A0A2N5TC52_9BASI|nr:hypothetical protein PCASD_10529 [Puccinia coronata f. sp. avenae]
MPSTKKRLMNSLPANQAPGNNSSAPASVLPVSSVSQPQLSNQPPCRPTKILKKEVQPSTWEIIVIDEETSTPSHEGDFADMTDTIMDPEEVANVGETAVTEGKVNSAICQDDLTTSEYPSSNALDKADRERLWKCAMDADLKGDVAASDMFYRLLRVGTRPVKLPATLTRPAPAKPEPPIAEIKRVPVPRVPERILTSATSPDSSTPLREKSIDLQMKGEQSIVEGDLLFVKNSVTSHTNLGFSPFFEKNIQELKAPLPLTIFDQRWQEATLTCHIHKRPRLDSVNRYTGHTYPNEWSQSYASWTKNHRSFYITLRDVYDLKEFAARMRKHKENVDQLLSVHGFLPAFRYDLLMRADTFSRRVSVNGVATPPDISQFRKDFWDMSYALSRKLNEFHFEDNPYRKGEARWSWDPMTGDRKGSKESLRSMVPDLYPDPNATPRQ